MSATATDCKTCGLERLLAARARLRAKGRTVVHCHGCFDIVHPGHIQHLQFARSLGDVLIVSVSADGQVNKGVDRPLIPEDLRASSLAALECVDLVYVNPDPTAEHLLEALAPDVYVKGREYEQSRDARFLAERNVVESRGGRVVFASGDVVYSSTALIGAIGRREAFADEKVGRLRQRHGLSDAHLENLLQRVRGLRVTVVGDYLLDCYHFCDATGVAGEGPILSLRAMQEKHYDGGAGVVALHLASFGARPTLVTALADDDASRQAVLRLQAAGVEVKAVAGLRQTIAKHRYLVEQQKLFKVDHGAAMPSDSRLEAELASHIREAAEGAAAVIFADFGYGVLTASLLDHVLAHLRATVPVLTADVSGRQSNLLRFQGVDLLCPTEREVREAQHDFAAGLGAVVWNLLNTTAAKNAIITLGKQGLVTFERDPQSQDGRLRSEHVPALSSTVIDPLGCGDALLAAASLTLAAGGGIQAAALIGSLAAAIEVQSIGNQPIQTEQLREMIYQRPFDAGAARRAS